MSMNDIVDGYLGQLGLLEKYSSLLNNIDESCYYPLMCDIVKKHVETFPFCTINHMLHFHHLNNRHIDNSDIEAQEENNDKRSIGWLSLGKMSSLDLYQRICVDRTGGYCFEHNKLVHDILKHLGYSVQLVLARVVNNDLIEPKPPLTHRITLVKINSNSHRESDECSCYYIVDCAFGGDKGPSMPIPVPVDHSNATDIRKDERVSVDEFGRSFRIIFNSKNCETKEDCYYMQCCHSTLTGGDYFTNYIFTLPHNYTYSEQDCTMGHFYSYNYPEAIFSTNLLVGSQCFHKHDGNNSEFRVLWNLNYRRFILSINNNCIDTIQVNGNNNNSTSQQKTTTLSTIEKVVTCADELHSILNRDFHLCGVTGKQCQTIFSIIQAKNTKS